MTSGNFPIVPTFKNIIPRTSFPIVAANITLTPNSPASKILKFTFNLRMTAGLSGSATASFRFETVGLSNFNAMAENQDWIASPVWSFGDSNTGLSFGSVPIAGTDADANTTTMIEIVVYNWDLQTPHYGHLMSANVGGINKVSRDNHLAFADINAITYDSLFINWAGKTPTSNCFYQVDQLA